MTESVCATPTPLPDLLAYWLGEMEGASEARFEEHLFGCEECAARLERLLLFRKAIRRELQEGNVSAVLSDQFIRRLKDAGTRVREYRMQPGGSVNCTVAPEDELVVSHLHAPLGNVRRLDIVLDEGEGVFRRLEDVAFDPTSNEVVLAPSVTALRRLGTVTQRAELIAVSHDEERVIGSYTFNHSPYSQGR